MTTARNILVRTCSAVELVAGGMLCSALSLILPAIGAIGLIHPGSRGADRLVAAAVVAVTIPLGGYCTFLVLAPAFGREMWGPDVALQLPRCPLLLRTPLALYWLAHFLLGAALAVGVERLGHAAGEATAPALGFMIIAALVALGFTLAANSYLLLSVSTLTGNEMVIRGVWRMRVLVDVAVAVAATLLGAVFS